MAESIQKLTPGQKKLFNKKLEAAIAAYVKKFDKIMEETQKDPYVYLNGMKIRKALTQCIPYTDEKWAEYLRDKADRDNKQLINYIDKVFFEDGGLQFKETGHRAYITAGNKKGWTH